MYSADDIIDPERLACEGAKCGLTVTAEQWREACELHVSNGKLRRISGGRYVPVDPEERHQWN